MNGGTRSKKQLVGYNGMLGAMPSGKEGTVKKATIYLQPKEVNQQRGTSCCSELGKRNRSEEIYREGICISTKHINGRKLHVI